MLTVSEVIAVGFGGFGSNFQVVCHFWESNTSFIGNVPISISKASVTSSGSWRAPLTAAINDFCDNNDCTRPENIWIAFDGEPGTTPVTKKKFFNATVSGGAGNVTFYTDTNGDGTGTALYSSLSTADLTCFVDGVSDQYAFPSISVAVDKKSVTVNVKKQNFSSGNVLLNLLGALTSVLTGVTYVNAANSLNVKMIIGIDD